MKKYKLINKNTNEEHLCNKITVDGFDYYFINQLPKVNDTVYNYKSKEVYKITIQEEIVNYEFPIICTNNPKINIPQVINEVEMLFINDYGIPLNKNSFIRKEGYLDGYNKSQETHSFNEKDMIDFAEFVVGYPSKNKNNKGEMLHAKSKYDQSERTIDLLKIWKKQKPKIIYYDSKLK